MLRRMQPHEKLELETSGYVVLPGFMPRGLLADLQTRVEELYAIEGEQSGSEFRTEPNTRRLANLVAKGEVFERIVAMPEILAYVGAVLGPDFKLSSLNARSADPHSDSHQPLHADMGLIADEHGYAVCNTVWMLDPFTEENGALRGVPGSHRWRKLPPPGESHPDEVLITGEAGTVVVMNAHMWHGGTANRTGSPRRAVHGFYCRSDIPQQQYQKRLIPANTQAGFSAELRRVLALDDEENDRLSSPMLKASGFLK